MRKRMQRVHGISNIVGTALLVIVAVIASIALWMSVQGKTATGNAFMAQATLVSARQIAPDKMLYVIQVSVQNSGNSPATISGIQAILVPPAGATTTSGAVTLNLWGGTSGTSATVNPDPAKTVINPGSSQSYVITFTGPVASQITLQLQVKTPNNVFTVSTNPVNVG